MFSKLSETFTATHFTILAGIAIIAPSALYATVATTAVSITDPNSGQKSFVDAARRLSVYDAQAGFANNPANYVRLYLACNGSGYAPPAGKALIIKAATLRYTSGTQGSINYGSFYVSGTPIWSLNSINMTDSATFDFGTGYYVKNGEQLSIGCSGTSYGNVVGYLVPSGAVPPTGSAEERAQSTPPGTIPPEHPKLR